ncbi:MAG: aminotransferase class V-fold PLP-dependent enzyme [Candidatus Riflebacteria bacterium]|nr:aminotransferase class V-fold PLP-dependent enzyme [Candidatus Riflebacteria bacterium]
MKEKNRLRSWFSGSGIFRALKTAVVAVAKRHRQVYLDNNATTPVLPTVVKRMSRVLVKNYGNPSSLYQQALESAAILEDSRRTLARTIHADIEEVFFTSCATEANNAVLKGLADHFLPEKNRILALPIEHPSVIQTLHYLETKGIEVVWIPVDRLGNADLARLDSLIDNKTFLIVTMCANNETGTLQNLDKICEIARRHEVMVFSDCVQAIGKVSVDFERCRIDYASFSAHKIHGPKGIGALYVRKGRPIPVFMHGGHQERGFRAGTESLHNIAGFAQACVQVPESLKKAEQVRSLKRRLVDSLKKIKPDLLINTPDNSLPNTLNVTFPDVYNAELIAALDYFGIAAAAGSACSTPDNKPSHVLTAIGLSETHARQTIRLSLSERTSRADIDYAVGVFREYFDGSISPANVVWPKQLNQDMIENSGLLILDIRFWYDRVLFSSINGSYETSMLTFKNYLDRIPVDKNILVVCQGGFYSPMVAFFLRSKGYKSVSYLASGLWGWKKADPELFLKATGKGIQKFDIESESGVI